MKQTAQVISIVLNPFIMPFLGVVLVLKYHGLFSLIYRADFANTLVVLAFVLTFLFPLLSIFVLYKSGMVSDINLSKKEERTLPTLLTLAYYLAYYYFLAKIEGISTTILAGYLGGCVALIIASFITPRWKISLHSQGISSLTGLFVGVTQVSFVNHQGMIIALFMCMGLVGTSRLLLKKHTSAQVYAGAALGFIIPYLFVVNNWAIY